MNLRKMKKDKNNNITTNIHTYILKICFICILLLNIACKENWQIHEYYYEVYQYMDSIPCEYQAIKIIDKNGIRQQITYRYNDKHKELTGKSTEYYKLIRNNILKLNNANDSGQLYMSAEYLDSCITYSTGNGLHDLVASITHCFLGKKRIKMDENTSITSYEFSKKYGMGMETVLYRDFYDTSFILLKTERISGYSGVESIRRINFIPYEFKSLLKQEQDWTQYK